MSSYRNRAARLCAPALCTVVLLAVPGCGFRPLYGNDSASHQPGAAAQMAAVEIPVLPDRIGQQLRNMLIDQMHGSGPAGQYLYKLNVVLRETAVELGLQPNSTSTRAQIRIAAEYWLTESPGGKTLLHERLRSSADYNVLVNQFGTVLANEDARERALQQIADELTQHLAVYFAAR